MIPRRRFAICLVLLLGLIITAAKPIDIIRPLPNRSFGFGEQVMYRVHYGFITAGEAVMRIDQEQAKVNNRPCYKLEVAGRSTGAFDRILRIRDTWGCLMDTSTYVPHKTWRLIEEGNYRRKEEIVLNQKGKSATIYVNEEKPKEFDLPGYVYDMVGGYYFLRLLDYDQMPVGQIITMNAILEDKLYNFKVRYKGKELLKTKLGKIQAIYLAPIMPANQLFEGENSIKFYISDDANRIPLKIRAELYVGAVELDIKAYSNLRNPIKFQ